MNLESSLGKNLLGGHTRTFTNSEESLKVTEYLGGGIYVEKAQGDIVNKNSVRKSSARCA